MYDEKDLKQGAKEHCCHLYERGRKKPLIYKDAKPYKSEAFFQTRWFLSF